MSADSDFDVTAPGATEKAPGKRKPGRPPTQKQAVVQTVEDTGHDAMVAENERLKAALAKAEAVLVVREEILAGRDNPADNLEIDRMVRPPDSGRMYRLTIFPTSENDRSDVFVSVNGYAYSIQRGKEVKVPEGVVDVLRNAVIKTMRYFPDERGKPPEPMDIHQYPFTAVPIDH